MKKSLLSTSLVTLVGLSYSSASLAMSPITSEQVINASNSPINTATPQPSIYNHSLDYENMAEARQITVGEKSNNEVTDSIFKDGFGREALFRGWNTSGAVKLASMNFKPFKNTEDAAKTFEAIKQKTGANQIRFTIAWEGVHPAPDVIDYDYLADVTNQMREAIKQDMYIIVDYHSDLYSRHTFTENSRDTGNGAPEWIVKGGHHGTDDCGLPCIFSWGAHKLSDNAVRSAMRAFWLNQPINTTKGTRYVQTEFLWQLGKVSEYLNTNLTPEERDYILGIEPLNEPFDAGIKELGLKDYDEFDNLILWPFYERTRQTMDNNGMADKLVYAEPNVFWYTTTGIVSPSTGYGFLKYAPGNRFVFAPHMYDQGRMGVGETTLANNASYLHKLDEVRKEARRLGMPVFLGEYGMWNNGKGVTDNLRIINASIQALETSNGQKTDTSSNITYNVFTGNKNRFADFYTPFINGTQWHWNYYYGNSAEYLNGNLNKLITEFDAWNNENFSVVQNYSQDYTQSANINERIYPRRTQGDLMHFAYNAKVVDKSGTPLDWNSIRVDLDNEFIGREYFRDRKFSIIVWRGRKANAPTELFVPSSFDAKKLTVITEKHLMRNLPLSNTAVNSDNEILLVEDQINGSNPAKKILIWDDIDAAEDVNNSIHYALVVEQTEDMSKQDLEVLQSALNQRIISEQKSALYLSDKMTYAGYDDDLGANTHFQLIEQRNNRCMDVQYANTDDGSKVINYDCNGSDAQRWQYNKTTANITSKLDTTKCLTAVDNPSQNSKLQIRTCSTSLNAQQQFIKSDNWGWVLKSNQTLAIDSFGGFSAPVGLWSVTGNDNQQWQVRY